jgi:hypothetical protein
MRRRSEKDEKRRKEEKEKRKTNPLQAAAAAASPSSDADADEPSSRCISLSSPRHHRSIMLKPSPPTASPPSSEAWPSLLLCPLLAIPKERDAGRVEKKED